MKSYIIYIYINNILLYIYCHINAISFERISNSCSNIMTCINSWFIYTTFLTTISIKIILTSIRNTKLKNSWYHSGRHTSNPRTKLILFSLL